MDIAWSLAMFTGRTGAPLGGWAASAFSVLSLLPFCRSPLGLGSFGATGSSTAGGAAGVSISMVAVMVGGAGSAPPSAAAGACGSSPSRMGLSAFFTAFFVGLAIIKISQLRLSLKRRARKRAAANKLPSLRSDLLEPDFSSRINRRMG